MLMYEGQQSCNFYYHDALLQATGLKSCDLQQPRLHETKGEYCRRDKKVTMVTVLLDLSIYGSVLS